MSERPAMPIASCEPSNSTTERATPTGRGIEWLARGGYAAKGVVYCLVGGFAFWAAAGSSMRARGSRAALDSLRDEPLGSVLLGVIGGGLAGYAVWCFFRAWLDPERVGVPRRLLAAAKGVSHAALVAAVIKMIFDGAGGGASAVGARDWTAAVMAWPVGKWLVVLAGACLAAYGFRQVYRACTADLDAQLALAGLRPATSRWLRSVSRCGVASRGVVFTVMGALLAAAGWHAEPSEAKGLAEALRYVGDRPYGPWLLGMVALGFLGYGSYEFARARYRRIGAT